MLDVNVIAAFIGGILSFASPCVLPLIPAYISYIAGISLEQIKENRGETLKRIIPNMLLFILGFSIIFIFMGMAASKIGQLLFRYFNILQKVAGIVIIIFGLHLTGIIKLSFLLRQAKIEVSLKAKGLTAFLLGLAFAFGWTPCVGPILAGILALAAQETTVYKGGGLLAVYSLGLAIPFFVSGLAVNQLINLIRKYAKHLRVVEILSGILLIILGILIFFNTLQKVVNLVY